MFQGFSQETQDFLWGLSFHNERPWFQEHKAEFERVLKEPFAALAEDTARRMAERFPELRLELHVARIYRDARRLFGRGPYKEKLWFSLKNAQSHSWAAAFWFELGAASYGYGMGFFTTPAKMEEFRAAVAANPGRLERIIRELPPKFTLGGEPYARPKGDLGETLNPWYNRRSIDLEYQDDFCETLFDPKLPETLAEDFASLMPAWEFLSAFDPPPEKR